MHVLLVGAGYMAKEYIKILQTLSISFEVIGKSEANAKSLEREFNIKVLTGGLEASYSKMAKTPTHVIIASNLESLAVNTLYLLNKEIKSILIEKPGAVTLGILTEISSLADEKKANVYIAYNRRFYESILEAERRIKKDGGLQSLIIEFTEWSHTIEKLNKSEHDLKYWFIANSTHVIDTAFYFGGKPKELSSYVQNKLDWHPSGSVYAGAGITENNILFSYHANWTAPGSWKLELLTNKNRYIFRPFEKLHVQEKGSININEIELENDLDILYKPGLYKQTLAFMQMNDLEYKLLTVKEATANFQIYIDMQTNRKRREKNGD